MKKTRELRQRSSGPRRRLVMAALGSAVVAHAQARALDGMVAPSDLVGTWIGEPSREDSTSTFALTIEGASGELRGKLSLPVLHVHDFPLGKIRVDGRELQAGPFTFTHDPAGGTLSGVLPSALVPVYSIPVVLRRSVQPIAAEPRPEPQAATPEPVWTYDAESPLWADVAFAHGTVYVAGDDGRLHAIDAASGKRRWFVRTGAVIRARPVVAHGTVYVQSDDGLLHAIGARNGKVRWRARVAREPIVRLPPTDPKSKFDYRASAVSVIGNRLYLGTHDGHVLALESQGGRRVWDFATADRVLSAPSVRGARVYAGSFDGKAYALHARTGALFWAHDTKRPVSSSPVVFDGLVLVGSRSYDFRALDATTGVTVWNRYLWYSWIESTPTVRDGIAYVGSSDAAKLFAIDARSGRSVWERDVLGLAWGQPAVTADRVFIGTRASRGLVNHRAAFFALERATSQVLWWYPLSSPAGGGPYGFPASAATGDGRVFVGALDGRVYAFDANR